MFVEGACVVAQWPVQVCRGLCAHVRCMASSRSYYGGLGRNPQERSSGAEPCSEGQEALKKLSHYCHGVRLIWNFFATSHWKGPVDGVGEH